MEEETDIKSSAAISQYDDDVHEDTVKLLQQQQQQQQQYQNGSGLTPSLGDLGVMGNDFDVATSSGLMGMEGSIMHSSFHEGFAEEEGQEQYEGEEDEEEDDEEDWLRLTPGKAQQVMNDLIHVKETFQDEVDLFDTTMVAEYAEDIFHHMSVLEVSTGFGLESCLN